MNIHEVRAWFEDHAVVDEADVPSGHQLAFLTELANRYAGHGILEAEHQPALWRRCPLADECWMGKEAVRPPEADGRSGLTLPWVGPTYETGGVVVVAINLRDSGGRLMEYSITCRSGGDGSVLNVFDGGGRRALGSRLAYGATRSAASVADWLAGRDVEDREDSRLLASVLESTVRLQAVKCSPDDGDRSTPTPAMKTNCPRLLLEDELEVLRPAAIVTVGGAAWQAVTELTGYEDTGWTDPLSWGRLDSRGRGYDVFSLDHPAQGDGWDRGHRDLLVELRQRAAASAP